MICGLVGMSLAQAVFKWTFPGLSSERPVVFALVVALLIGLIWPLGPSRPMPRAKIAENTEEPA
jgi:hypothetical protein